MVPTFRKPATPQRHSRHQRARRAGSLCTFPLAPPSRKLRRVRARARAARPLCGVPDEASIKPFCCASQLIQRDSIRMRSSFVMMLAMVLGLIDTGSAQCTNTCSAADDLACDDGGPGAQHTVCLLGSDCSDCGPRVAGPPPPHQPPSPALPPPPPPTVYPPAPVGMFYRCTETCSGTNDNTCNDGGPGSEFSACTLGTDCTDCGPRLIVMAPPSAPAVTPDIVVSSNNNMYPNECTWTLTCAGGYSFSNGTVPQTVTAAPLVPGSTCTLTLFSQYGFGWSTGTWVYGALSFTIADFYDAYSATFSFTVPYPAPPPGAPKMPPVAPIPANTGFAMVVPQLIITYKFDGFSTACTTSNSQLIPCTPGVGGALTPSVAGTTPWDPRNTLKLTAQSNIQMGCGGTPRCDVAPLIPVDTLNGGIQTLKIKATVTWTDAARLRTCPPIAPRAPPSPPSRPPPPPPPLPVASSDEVSVEMIALGMGLYHERYIKFAGSSPHPPPSSPPFICGLESLLLNGADIAPLQKRTRMQSYNMTYLTSLMEFIGTVTITGLEIVDAKTATAIYTPPSSPPRPNRPPSSPPPPSPPRPPSPPPSLCQNTCNARFPQSKGKCDDGANNNGITYLANGRPAPARCELGSDCDDCGLRSHCTSCPSECSSIARRSASLSVSCLEFMYRDATTCWPQCNIAECGHKHCTKEAAVSECLKKESALGNDYTSMPGSGSVPLVTGSFTMGELRISVDKVKGAGVQIEFPLTYSLTWNDTRLLLSPCRRVLDTMLSSAASAESKYANLFWRPKLALGTETEPARERKLLESLYSQDGAVARLQIREAVTLSQDFQYRNFPFDRQIVRIDLRLPTVQLSGCEALVEQLRYKETLSFEDSNRILPQSATWLWDHCGTAGGGCRAADIEKDIVLDLAFLQSRQGVCPVFLKIRRNNNIFIIKQLVPSIVISEAPLLSLYLDGTVPPLIGARASLHIIALLLVVTRANTDLGLGTLSSLIWTDEFALVQFFVILAGLVETIVVHALIRFGCKVLATSVDGVFRILLPFVLFPCLVVGFILKGLEQQALFLLVIVGGMLLFLSYSVARVLYMDWQIQRNRKKMVKKLKALKMESNGSKLTDKEVDQIMRKTFDTFDLDRSKKLEKAEVRLILDAMYPNLGRQQVAMAMKAVKSDEIVYEDFAIVVEEWQKISFEKNEEEHHKRTILSRLGFGSKSKKAWQRAGAKASLAKTSKQAGSSAPKFDARLQTLQKGGAPEKVADAAAAFAAGLDKADSTSA